MEADCLLLVVDARPAAWAALDAAARAPGAPPAVAALSFPSVLTAVATFACAFGASSRRAQLAVWGFNGETGGYILPAADAPQLSVDASGGGGAGDAGTLGDMLRPAAVRRAMTGGLMRLRYGAAAASAAGGGDGGGALHPVDAAAAADPRWSARHGSLAACLSLAMCHHHRLKRAHPHLRSRVLVVQAGRDTPAQYVPLINAAFTAQRHHVAVDSVLLTPGGPGGGAGGASAPAPPPGHPPPSPSQAAHHSVFLTQAAHLTGGTHVHPTPAQAEGLLALLVHVLLPPPAERPKLLLPPPHPVDLRAHCFCHRQHRTVAWVCTVCLAIFCSYTAVCATCGTRAPDAPAPAGGAGAGAAAPPAAGSQPSG